eukprot:g26380.t1
MVRDQKVLLFIANKAQMLYKAVSEPPFGLTNVEEATSGAADAVDHIGGCAGEPLTDVEGLFSALNGGEGGGVGAGSVLGPLLFVIYINYPDVNIGDMDSKFADDTKIG